MAVLELSAEQIYELARQLLPEERESLVIRLQSENSFSVSVPTKRIPGQDKGKIWIAPDFNDPLPDEFVDAFYQ